MTVTYKISSPSIEKLVNELHSYQILIKAINKTSSEECEIEIDVKDKKKFLTILEKNKVEAKEIKLSFLSSVKKFVKLNVIFIIVAILVVSSVLFSNLFVLKTAIYGLNCLNENEVLKVLKENGYGEYKLRFNYDLDRINSVLTSNLRLVSFASAVIVGSTLVVNINEKIDNSEYIYDYPPIVAPIDCIVLDVTVISGTKTVENLTPVKAGEIVINPFVTLSNGDIIPTPAKAEVNAKFEISSTFKESENIFDNEKEKLYNMIDKLDIRSSVKEEVTYFTIEQTNYITIWLSGTFTFR